MTDLTYSQPHHTVDRREVFSSNENRLQISQLFRNWKIRRKVRALDEHDDHLLDDIGVLRNEIAWASNLPLSINAAVALNDRANRRRNRSRAF